MSRVIKSVESASSLMKDALEVSGFLVEATSAPSIANNSSLDIYRRYIALTQRLLDSNGQLLCYITYRVTQTRGDIHPSFSSYELLNINYEPITNAKWHLRDYPDSFSCFRIVYNYILSNFNV